MKFRNALAGFMVVAGVATAHAQGARKVNISPEESGKATVAALFSGIALSADTRHSADSIAAAAVRAMSALGPSPDRRVKINKIADDRNFDLRALLTSEADKGKFDSNARIMTAIAPRRPPAAR